jgi:hypothetical protein
VARVKSPNHGGARPGAGPHPKLAVLRAGAIVSVTLVYPEGVVAIGRIALVTSVERIKGGRGDRLVKIPQSDGSELRIVIGYE